LWLIRFAHSPPSFIFWLGRHIFGIHPDNIYINEVLSNFIWPIWINFRLVFLYCHPTLCRWGTIAMDIVRLWVCL
jgi:hypothetical protein